MSPPHDAARRPDAPEKRRRFTEEELRPRPPHPAVDFMVGVLVLAVDGTVCLVLGFLFAMRSWADSSRAVASREVHVGGGPARAAVTPPPAVDWTPTLTFGVITALAVLSVFGFAHARRPITAAFQAVASVVLLIITLSTSHTP